MSSNIQNPRPSADGRASTFATSSTDFALPFGSSRSTPPTGTAANNAAFAFHSGGAAASSVPISIPSSPSLLSLCGTLGSSPSKLAAAGLGLGALPSPSTREHHNPFPSSSYSGGQPQSPTLSLAGDGWPPPPPPFHALPSAAGSGGNGVATSSTALLRRAPGMSSPGFAIASPARFRRASMLGREITPFSLDQDECEDEEDMSRDSPPQQQAGVVRVRRRSNQGPDDGDDEMMHVEEDDETLTRTAPSTPLMGPPRLFSTPGTPPPSCAVTLARPSLAATSAHARASASDSGQDSSSSTGLRTNVAVPRSPRLPGSRSRSSSLLSSHTVVRKAVTRRANLLPKDRSVSRVAASLQDEVKPQDSEIASEAKLQKRLGGEATLPRAPRFGTAPSATSTSGGGAGGFLGASTASGTRFNANARRSKYMWDDDVDDIRGVFTADGLDDLESSDVSSDDDDDDDDDDEEEHMIMYGYALPSGSLSDEEDELRCHTAAGGAATARGSGAVQSTLGTLPTAAAAAAGALNGNGGVNSLPKRNNALWMGFRDKGSAHAHKCTPTGSANVSTASTNGNGNGGERAAWRRAAAAPAAANANAAAGTVSAGAGLGGGGGSAMMDVDTSPRVGSTRMPKRKTEMERWGPYKRRAVSPMGVGTAASGAAVLCSTSCAGASAAGGNSPLLMPVSSPSAGVLYRGIHAYHAYARCSTSPTISRPCTPVQSTSGAPTAAFSPAAAGSGPGYGSGALGLSISANTTAPRGGLEARMQIEAQQLDEAVMDQRVGMLGLS